MRKEEDEIGLIKIVIINYGIVDHNGKEDGGAAEDSINKRIGGFVESGFVIQRAVRSHHGIEDEPTQRDSRHAQPEALGQYQFAITIDGF